MAAVYPVDFPLADIQEVIRIVRAGTFLEELPALHLHGWWVEGYVAKLVLPLPTAGSPIFATDSVQGVKLAELRHALMAEQQKVRAVAGLPPWVALLIEFILALLEILFKAKE